MTVLVLRSLLSTVAIVSSRCAFRRSVVALVIVYVPLPVSFPYRNHVEIKCIAYPCSHYGM